MISAHALFGPPGTGKTTEMLRRVAEAKSRGYKPTDIGFFSFTKAAANEALKRLGLTRSDKISTIHAQMFRLAGYSTMAVVDNYKLKKLGEKIGVPFAGFTAMDTGEQMEVGDHYVGILNKARSMMVDPTEEYYNSARPGDHAQFVYFVESYDAWRKANGFIDFTDMLEKYLQNPRNHGARILFIDEAQDLSLLQWAVIDRMIQYEQVEEVHIAGDDDQAIYEWSGANTHGMAEFVDRYGAEVTVLQQSYRVPIRVFNIANSIVRRITKRVPKEYEPRPEVGTVNRFQMFDPKSVKHGDDVMILCRNWVTKQEIEQTLINFRVPYSAEGGRPGLYDSRYADAIRAYNRLLNGDEITSADIEKMVAVADARTKSELIARNFRPMLQRGWQRSFSVPHSLIDFFLEADLYAKPTIRVSTIHSAKGREANHIVLHTGLTGKTIADMDANPDAEARVWYVGVTRSRQRLDVVESPDMDGYNLDIPDYGLKV